MTPLAAKAALRPVVIVAVGSLVGCAGSILEPGSDTERSPGRPDGEPGPGTSEAPGPVRTEAGIDPGPAPLRRLTYREWELTVRGLLGVDTEALLATLPVEPSLRGYDNQAGAQQIDRGVVAGLSNAAAEAARRWYGSGLNREDLVVCAPEGLTDRTCMVEVVQLSGLRAFRRPMADGETNELVGAALAEAEETNDFYQGVQFALEALVQMPSFLYRLDRAEPVSGVDGLAQLDDWSLATELGFLLRASGPDQSLLERAARGELANPDELAAATRALLAEGEANNGVVAFVNGWLRLGELDNIERDSEFYPEYSAELARSMKHEAESFVLGLARGAKDMRELFVSNQTMVDGLLASFYGLDGVPADGGFVQATQADRRRGLFGQAAILSLGQRPVGTSPTYRGAYVRDRLVCAPVPPPPADADTTLKEPEPGVALTTRDRLERHVSDPACASCHRLTDGIGFGLEGFDAIGRFRTEENGIPINDEGILALDGTERTFRGPAELGAMLAESDSVDRCLVEHLLQWTRGRPIVATDAETLDQLTEEYRARGRSFEELVVSVVTNHSFRFRRENRR